MIFSKARVSRLLQKSARRLFFAARIWGLHFPSFPLQISLTLLCVIFHVVRPHELFQRFHSFTVTAVRFYWKQSPQIKKRKSVWKIQRGWMLSSLAPMFGHSAPRSSARARLEKICILNLIPPMDSFCGH